MSVIDLGHGSTLTETVVHDTGTHRLYACVKATRTGHVTDSYFRGEVLGVAFAIDGEHDLRRAISSLVAIPLSEARRHLPPCTCNPDRPGDCRSHGCDPECPAC